MPDPILIASLLGGLVLLALGGDLLVRGAVRAGRAMGASPLIAGIFFVALGTSLPEIFVSVETDFVGDYKGTHPDSAFETWNEDLGKSPSWFNGTAHPQITFKSTSAAQSSPNTGTVTGDLTFLGVTKPVTLDVTYNGMVQLPWAPDQDRIGFSATTTLKRSDFGMSENLAFVGDEVEVIIQTEFLEVIAP